MSAPYKVHKYHQSPLTGRVEKCRAYPGNCPYKSAYEALSQHRTVPLPTHYGIPLEDGKTLSDVRDEYEEKRRIERVIRTRRGVRDFYRDKDAITEFMLSEGEREALEAWETLVSYDNGKNGDPETNFMLGSLMVTHPKDFKRLARGFNKIKGSNDRKKAIKDVYDFLNQRNGYVYGGLVDEELDDTNEDESYLVDWSRGLGNPEIAKKVEYLVFYHPSLVTEVVDNVRSIQNDSLSEVYVEDFHSDLVNMDDEEFLKRKKITLSGRFRSRVQSLVSMLRRFIPQRKFFFDGEMNDGVVPKEGEVVSGGWVYSKGQFFKESLPKSDETYDTVSKIKDKLSFFIRAFSLKSD